MQHQGSDGESSQNNFGFKSKTKGHTHNHQSINDDDFEVYSLTGAKIKNQDINKLSWYLLRKSGSESDNIVFMISDTGILVKPQ